MSEGSLAPMVDEQSSYPFASGSATSGTSGWTGGKASGRATGIRSGITVAGESRSMTKRMMSFDGTMIAWVEGGNFCGR